MLIESQTTWLERLSGNGFSVSFKNVVIMFYCKEQPIVWKFVQEFSRRLLTLTQEGWTGCYRLMLSHAKSGMTVEVSLGLVEEGQFD